MLELLFSLMVAAALFQRTCFRSIAALAYVGGAVAHNYFLGDTTGLLYYGSAAIVDIGVLALIIALPRADTPVRLLGLACIISAGLNAVGWCLWFAYLPSSVYNTAFLGLYCFVLYAMCQGVASGRGTVTNASSRADVLLSFNKRWANFFAMVGGGSRR